MFKGKTKFLSLYCNSYKHTVTIDIRGAVLVRKQEGKIQVRKPTWANP